MIVHYHLPTKWVDSWWESFSVRMELYVICVYEKGSLSAIAPFAIENKKYRFLRVNTARLMVNGHSPFSGLIFKKGSDEVRILSEIIDFLSVKNYVIGLNKISLELSNIIEGVVGRKGSSERLGKKRNIETPVIYVRSSWDEYFSGLSKKHRCNIRNKMNKFSGNENLSICKKYVLDSESPLFEDMISISENSWKAKVGRDLTSDVMGLKQLKILAD